MKYKIILNVYILFLFLIIASCGLNFFSVFTPTNTDAENNVSSLLIIGDNDLNNLDYTNAYKAYLKAMTLSPTNSRAIEGVCTAYLYMKIPITDVFSAVLSASYNKIGMNKLFDVSSFLATNLEKIIDNKADGVIPYNDVNINLNFFIFNSLYSIFYFADSDDNKNIENDSNDVFLISANFKPDINPAVTNLLNKATNKNSFNPFAMAKVSSMLKPVKPRYLFFTNNINKSYACLAVVEKALSSADTIQKLNSITSIMSDNVNSLTNFFNLLDNTNSGSSISPVYFTNIFMITNIVTNAFAVSTNIITNDNVVTNLISSGGYSPGDYNQFTNDMQSGGVTNLSDMTNIAPGLSNINIIVTNYFGL